MIDDAASVIRVFGDVMGRTVAVSATPCGTVAASPGIIGDNPRMATRSSSSKNGADYSEASIRVLKGLEPVRQRPGMYTRTENPLHIIQEVIDNAADEALGGYARHIDVRLFKDGRVEVTDDGRGIPVGLHPDEGVPGIECPDGVCFNANATWWRQSRAFLTWTARNAVMLVQGKPVSDVCVICDDEAAACEALLRRV